MTDDKLNKKLDAISKKVESTDLIIALIVIWSIILILLAPILILLALK